MKLYTVDYWVTFPNSEYGGLYVIAAESVDQVVNICLADTCEWYFETCKCKEEMEKRIREGCTIIGTTVLFDKPCVVNCFYT